MASSDHEKEKPILNLDRLVVGMLVTVRSLEIESALSHWVEVVSKLSDEALYRQISDEMWPDAPIIPLKRRDGGQRRPVIVLLPDGIDDTESTTGSFTAFLTTTLHGKPKETIQSLAEEHQLEASPVGKSFARLSGDGIIWDSGIKLEIRQVPAPADGISDLSTFIPAQNESSWAFLLFVRLTLEPSLMTVYRPNRRDSTNPDLHKPCWIAIIPKECTSRPRRVTVDCSLKSVNSLRMLRGWAKESSEKDKRREEMETLTRDGVGSKKKDESVTKAGVNLEDEAGLWQRNQVNRVRKDVADAEGGGKTDVVGLKDNKTGRERKKRTEKSKKTDDTRSQGKGSGGTTGKKKEKGKKRKKSSSETSDESSGTDTSSSESSEKDDSSDDDAYGGGEASAGGNSGGTPSFPGSKGETHSGKSPRKRSAGDQISRFKSPKKKKREFLFESAGRDVQNLPFTPPLSSPANRFEIIGARGKRLESSVVLGEKSDKSNREDGNESLGEIDSEMGSEPDLDPLDLPIPALAEWLSARAVRLSVNNI